MVGKLIGTEAGVSTILSSFGAEAATGQVELIAIEAAILGIVLSGKAIAHKIKENKAERQRQEILDEQNRQQIEDNAREDAEMISRRNAERDSESSAINGDLIQNQGNQLESERQHRIRQMEEERIHGATNDPDMWMMSNEARRQIRQREDDDRRRRDQDDIADIEPNPEEEKKQGYDPNENYYQRRFGGGPDGGNGGNGNGGNGGNGNGGNNNNSRNKNPYDNVTSWLQTMINQQEDREKDRQTKEQTTDDKLTDAEKLSTELQKETLDNQHIMQEQINQQLLALGESEKTSEQVLVELEAIDKLLDQQIKMDPTSVFSSELINF